MQPVELDVPGSFLFSPHHHRDERGSFHESIRFGELATVVGRPFVPEQVNFSVSRRNTLRGVHSVTVPPGQAKFVTCVRGAVRDIVVDLRIGSPTYGTHAVSHVGADSGNSLYIPEGVGHGFLTLAEDTCVCYVLSSSHVPGTQVDIDPFDPDLALPWNCTEPPLMSTKDRSAPTAAEAAAAGLLAHWQDVR
ncbi:dTDP-4-dehydrorhamnose 3,5-epimerase family protein [Streptomyces sp. CA2R101]|uniref:dTDP-4-dehydrorhamnose 3,5-epimerase family protein n=1 Tax=Streptomyces sp. CA2R101 TaxID=3120152 RepID=UPI00300A591F